MADEKIRVKDLAAELGAQPKELVRVGRELGMAVKSVAGSVDSSGAARLREHFSAQSKGEREAPQPSVIVRRRRRPEPGAAAAEPASPGAETPASSENSGGPVSAQPKTDDADPVQGAAPAATQTPAPEAPAPEHRAHPRPRVAAVPGARIISRPSAEPQAPPEPAPEEPKAPPKPRGTSPVKADILAREEAAQPRPALAREPGDAGRHAQAERHARRVQRPDASASPDGSSAPNLVQKAMDREGAEGAAQARRPEAEPRVRIISRPDPASAPSRPAPRQRPGQRPEGARPAGAPGSRPAPRSPLGAGRGGPRADFSQPPAQPGDGQSKKKRQKGRRTVDFQQGDFGRRHDEEDSLHMTRSKGRRKNVRPAQAPTPVTQPLKAAKRKIRVNEVIRVADMAHQMGLKANEIIKVLFNLGVMATINQALDIDTATLVAAEFEYEVEKSGFYEEDVLAAAQEDSPESLRPRAPVVTIMGHVDHGKTSLLDAIRQSNVTGGEAGGITQHIGAYHVSTPRGEIVFLDTPGHEAFTAMRARGAQVTDLVILVVAADDGVMEQTREAINHSRAANVPIMVAVNKIDKPGADPDRVLRELAELGLQAEDWGGDTIVARVSAKTREGLDDLLELVALQAEVMELKANPDRPARGHIIEARLDRGRGPVATVLIQAGTLKQGDNFVCGQFSGRARALISDQGTKVAEAGPSMPVEVQGFEGVPEAGEEFLVVEDEKLARRIASTRATRQREKEMAAVSRVTLETFLAQSPTDEETLSLNLVLKADVQGTLEAISEALNKLSTDKVRINIVHGGAGAISESDIQLAAASQAIIIGFNVRPAARIRDVAEHENVDIRFYDIIYKLVDDIRSAMAGLLAPVQREVYLGQAEVRETYNVARVGVIAGAYVSDGKMARNAGVRLLRDGVVIYTGRVASLRRFKDDVREVAKGNECGIGLENFNDIKIGDVIEAFETVEEAATL